MLKRQGQTTRIVAISKAIVVVEIERSWVIIIVIAPSFEERISTIREVRVRYSLIPIIFLIYSLIL